MWELNSLVIFELLLDLIPSFLNFPYSKLVVFFNLKKVGIRDNKNHGKRNKTSAPLVIPEVITKSESPGNCIKSLKNGNIRETSSVVDNIII